jgi:hypothetical protein
LLPGDVNLPLGLPDACVYLTLHTADEPLTAWRKWCV